MRPSSAMVALRRGASKILKTIRLPALSPLQDTPRLFDICQTIRASRTPPRLEEGYGCICDERSTELRKYQLFPTSISKEDNDTVSLGTVFKDTSGTLPHLSLEIRFYLATVLASSFLQLTETGWLPQSLTHRDVFFAKRNSSVSYRDVFITKSFTEPATPAENPPGTVLPYNGPILSLGILLIELILVTPFHDLKKTTALRLGLSHDLPKHVTEYKVAMSLLDRVRLAGDDAYKNAVRRCIDNEYGDQSLEDDGIQQFLYAGVVELLEQGLKMLELLDAFLTLHRSFLKLEKRVRCRR